MEDAVQPSLERARLVVLHRAEDPDERLLGEVLRVVLAAGQAICQSVHPIGVLAHEFVPRRHGGLVTGGVEHRGARQLIGWLNPFAVSGLLEMSHEHGCRCGGRRILQVTSGATITGQRLDTRGNRFVAMVIPWPPASVVFHGSTFSDRGELGI